MAIKFLNSVNADSGVLYVDAANDRVGIGTTSPDSGLDVRTTSRFWHGSTSNYTSFAYGNEINTFNSSGGNAVMYLQYRSGHLNVGAGTLFVQSGNSNVGIGTTSPSQKLHVAGNAIIENSSGAELNLKNTSSGSQWQVVSGYNGGFEIGDVTNSLTDASAVFFITSSTGRVGIGTTAPAYKLDVNGTARVSDLYVSGNIIHDGDTNNRIIFGTDTQTFRTAGTDRLHITSAGNVGIGTTSPVRPLHIHRSATSTDVRISLTDGTTGAGTDSGFDIIKGTGQNAYLWNYSNASMRFGTNSTERMRITNTGNVGIGTTSPNALLEISRGDSGQTTAVAGGDNLILSDSSNGGMSIFTPSTALGSIFFGDESDSDVGWIRYNHTNDYMLIGTGGGTRVTIKNNGLINLGAYGAGYLKSDASGNITVDSDTIEDTLDSVTDRGNTTTNAITVGGVDSNGGVTITRSASNTQLKLKRTTSATGEFNIYTNSDSLYFQNVGQSTYPMVINSSGNVGIGATSPGSTLHVDGTVRFVNSGFAGFEAHNTNGTWESFIGTETGGGGNRYNSASSQHTFYNNSTAVMRINSSGNVGIGTTTPENKLHVYGGRIVIDNAANAQSAIQINSAGSEKIVIYRPTSTEDLRIYTPSAGDAFTLTQSGNVGIGTTSPSAKLHVKSSGNGAYILRGMSSAGTDLGGLYQSTAGDGEIYLKTSAVTTNVRISSNNVSYLNGGNVGIGTTSPSQKLHVVGKVLITDDVQLTGSNPRLDFNSNGASSLRFYDTTNATERMRINESGNVGIGDSAPSFILDVNNTNSRVRFKAATGDSNLELSAIAGRDWLIQSKADGEFRIYDEDAAAVRLKIDTSGNLQLPAYGAGYLKTDASGNISVDTSTIEDTLQSVTDRGNSTTNNLRISNSSPDLFFETGATHYNWMLAAQENIDAGFEISVGSQDADSSNDTWSPKLVVKQSGNVGVGTTSPSTKLHISGDVTGTNKVLIENTDDGTNSYAGLGFQSDFGHTYHPGILLNSSTNTAYGGVDSLNIWQYHSKPITLVTNNVVRAIVTGGGDIGIGTTSPSYKFHVVGTGYVSDDLLVGVGNAASWHRVSIHTGGFIAQSGNKGVGVYADTNADSEELFAYDYTASNYIPLKIRSSALNFQNDSGGSVMYHDGTNVGIGKTDPSYKLDVNGNSRIYGNAQALTIQGSNHVYLGWSPAGSRKAYAGFASANDTSFTLMNEHTGHLYLGTNANIKMTILSSGNVGIGTTSPVRDLHLHSASNTQMQFTDDGTGSSSTNGLRVGWNGSVGQMYLFEDADIRFATNDSEKVRITSSGNVGIGTSSPGDKLHVAVSSGNYQVAGDASGNIYHKSQSGEHRFRADGGTTNAFTIANNLVSTLKTAYFSGNVGIGTASPSEKLHVSGNVRIEGDLTVNGSYTQIDTDVNTTEQWNVTNDGTGPAVTINQTGAQDIMDVQDDGSSVFYIEDGGNIGIGTTDPAANVDVKSAANPTIRITSGKDGTWTADEEIGSIEFYSSDGSGVGAGVRSAIRSLAYDNFGSRSELTFSTTGTAGDTENMRITSYGKLKLNQYGSNTFTGTAAYALAVDSSGNVIETTVQTSPAGIDGTGTVGYLTKWSTTDTITDSVIVESSSKIGIGISSPSSVLHIKDDTSTVYSATDYQKDFIIERKNTSGNNQSAHIRFLVTGYEGQTTAEASIGVVQTSNVSSGHIVFTNRHNGTRSETVRIQSDGNVGIGTTSPLGKLQVNEYTVGANGNQGVHGEVSIFANSGDESLFLGVKNASYPNRGWAFNTVAYGVNSNLQIKEHGSTAVRMTIQSGGNVGIGTSTPDRQLQVHESTSGTSTAKFTNSTTGEDGDTGFFVGINGSEQPILYGYNNTDMIIGTNGSERMRITSSGNVGIGTTSPRSGYNLTLDKSTNVSGEFVGISIEEAGGAGYGYIKSEDQLTPDTSFVIGHTSRVMTFETNSTERVRIDNSGNVGIGTTSPNGRLQVDGDIYVNGADKKIMNYNGAVDYGTLTNNSVRFNTDGNERLRITGGGNVGIGTTSPATKLDVSGGWITVDNGYGVAFGSGGATPDDFLQLNDTSSSWLLNLVQDSTTRFGIKGVTGDAYIQGKLGIGTTSPIAKLDVNGATRIGGKTTYSKGYASLSTTGNAVAGLGTSGNGASARFVFEMHGGAGEYQRIVYSCYNASGNWYPTKVIDEGTNAFDVTDSGNGTTVTFTFKARTASQAYTPYVTIEHVGAALDTSYL